MAAPLVTDCGKKYTLAITPPVSRCLLTVKGGQNTNITLYVSLGYEQEGSR